LETPCAYFPHPSRNPPPTLSPKPSPVFPADLSALPPIFPPNPSPVSYTHRNPRRNPPSKLSPKLSWKLLPKPSVETLAETLSGDSPRRVAPLASSSTGGSHHRVAPLASSNPHTRRTHILVEPTYLRSSSRPSFGTLLPCPLA